MIGSCNKILDNEQRCNSRHRLYSLLFRDPEARSVIEIIDFCEMHYRHLIEELMGDQKGKQRQIENLRHEIATYREAGKKYDIYYDVGKIYSQIDDLRKIIKYQLTNECKNIFCRNNLSSLPKDQKLYSVTTFTPNGKRHYTFYFCQLKCFNIMRAKCGLKIPIHIGQTTL